MSFIPSLGVMLAYLAASALLALTPGPDMALFLSRTLSGGRAAGFAALAGAMSGLLAHTFAAALGLSALLAASSQAYGFVKMAGAAYLLWLAFAALRHGSALRLESQGGAGEGLRQSYLTGLGINLTNPKIILFFVTFLPQFIDAGDPAASGKIIFLGAFFIVVGALLNVGVILAASRFIGKVRENPGYLRAFDYGFAALMTGFAARLIWTQAK